MTFVVGLAVAAAEAQKPTTPDLTGLLTAAGEFDVQWQSPQAAKGSTQTITGRVDYSNYRRLDIDVFRFAR